MRTPREGPSELAGNGAGRQVPLRESGIRFLQVVTSAWVTSLPAAHFEWLGSLFLVLCFCLGPVRRLSDPE